jgi:hypothetical protein
MGDISKEVANTLKPAKKQKSTKKFLTPLAKKRRDAILST